MFSGRIGARYDHEKVAPKDLNAPCSTACLDEGKPAGNSFSNWNGLIGLNAQLNPTWQIGYTLSSGHRVPTASEMYFTFTNPYGVIPPFLIELMGRKSKALLLFKNRWTTIY